MLLNLRNEKIESQYHTYIKPTQRPILSSYCINLTGINQNFINNQATFAVGYQQFMNWLEEIRDTKGLRFTTPNMRSTQLSANTTFCSWTNWDLSHYFSLDCQRNSLKWPTHLRAWIDARKIFEVGELFLLHFLSFDISNTLHIPLFNRENIRDDSRLLQHYSISNMNKLEKLIQQLMMPKHWPK